MKASSQAAGWKGILIKHGEKGALGIIGALVLWMMFSAMQKEGLKPDKSPANLVSRVENGERYIVTAVKLKQDNGGEKFRDEPYQKKLDNGLEPIQIDGFIFNTIPDDFPKIAKRAQPLVFPVEDVHATALVVQVALNDPAVVKQQIGAITDRNDKAAREKLKKEQARVAKEQADAAKKAKQQANQKNPSGGEGGGRKNKQKDPLQQPEIGIQQPQAPIVQRPPHPAIQNLTGITSATKGIAVVTALIPYKKQLIEFNKAIVEGKDLIPGRKPEDDAPQIATFIVERALVGNPNDAEEKLAWVDITGQAKQFFTDNGKQLSRSEDPVVHSLLGPETVGLPKKNIPQWFTVSPLPTLADRKWQREVTHPRIPLFTDLTVEEIVIEQANAFMPVAPAAGGAGGFGQPAPVVGPPVPEEVEFPEYVLFRHIDFNVAPGQTYRYRVTLAYVNPNVGLDSKYLGTGVAVTDILPTTASKASNSVALAPLHAILAGGDVNYPPPKRYDAVPTSRIWQWLIDIDQKRGGEVAKDFPGIGVGDLLEFTGTIKNILNRPAGQPEELIDYAFSQHKIPRPTMMPYLVDVFGKEAPPAPTRPRPQPGAAALAPTTPEPPREQPYSEVLYVDQDGKLRSSSSPYADTTIDNYKLRYESTQSTGNPGGGSEMPGLAPPRPEMGNPLFKGAEMRGKSQTR
jgi:hypothetical protein